MKAKKTSIQVLAENSVKFRQCMNLTQVKAAQLIGIGNMTLYRIETQTSDPTISTVEKMAKAFKTTPSELLQG